MPIEIKMPALSPTMTEGNLAKWLKQEGDDVAAGDIIAEIETDKATMEVEAVDEGRLGRILVNEGTEGVAVNAPIALLLEEGEDASALEAAASAVSSPEPAPPAAEPQPSPAAAPAPAPSAPAAPTPSKGNGQVQPAGAAGRIFASPLAKRMAALEGLDLGAIDGSGPHGRIVKADIERALRGGAGKAPAAQDRAPSAGPKAAAGVTDLAAPEEIPLTNMRKVIARRLTEAKQTIPHFYLTMDCELDALLALRKQLNGREEADYKLSVNDFVIKASALALKKVPMANVSFAGDKLLRYKSIDISVAVAIPDGLITPIVRKADKKGLGQISEEMKDLAARAKDGKLAPEEFQGGSFSISNLGMFGVKDFQAVINPPQACILAVGAGEQRPVIKDGAVSSATVMSCTLSIDHRAVDGALGAQLLRAFKSYIEDPLSMLL
ncbi:MAG: pyruvate dehydrogenase complex dihydrolipoamide acetyltransferase [Alphaproteobacteria bacterium]|nr:pyruvate dehydrogenase complex dihydrolipoamide acetyltransferase [Alphaproteobacteria bacterium]